MKQYFIYFKYQYFINCWTTYIGTERTSEEYLGTKKYTAVEDLKNSNLFSISGSEDDLIAEQEFSVEKTVGRKRTFNLTETSRGESCLETDLEEFKWQLVQIVLSKMMISLWYIKKQQGKQ